MKKIAIALLLAALVLAVGCSWGGGEPVASAKSGVSSAPTNLTATPGDTQVALSWTAGSDPGATYNVYYGTSSSIAAGMGTKLAVTTGTSTTVTGLTDNTTYYFVVTAVNGRGESAASNVASATPAKGLIIPLTSAGANPPGLQIDNNTSLVFTFPAGIVNTGDSDTVYISAVTQPNLPVQFSRKTRMNGRTAMGTSNSGDVFLAAFELTVDPTTFTAFNVPVGVSGSVGTSVPSNTTINLAILDGNAWVDIATFVVGANSGAFTENLPSFNLPGLLKAGYYLLYEPAPGTNTSVSNLGIALIADDGFGLADGSGGGGLQVLHLYDSKGNLLNPPTIAYLDYTNAYDLDGQAMTPDGSQGIMVDGGNTVRFFSKVQTGVPIASTTTVDIGAYGGDGDSVAILPNGDEAVVTGDACCEVVVVSGILSGKPVVASSIPIPDNRDGLVVSNDGTALLARGYDGLTVYSIASITPVAGTIGGTISHSFTKQVDLPKMGSNSEDGRDGMAISPKDSSRAAIITYGDIAGADTNNIQLLTGLPMNATVGSSVAFPNNYYPYSIAISPDGKLAVVGGSSGLLLFSGVDTGTLAQVGTAAYVPSYTLNSSSATLGTVTTLGITLDGKYVVAGDQDNRAIVVIPFDKTGFGAPASVLGGVAIPDNDQLLIH